MDRGIKSMPVWKWALLLLASLFLSVNLYGLGQAAFDVFGAKWAQCLTAVCVAAAMVALYALFVKWFERHPARDLPLNRLAPDALKGLGLGVVYFVVLVLVMFVCGLYKFDAFGTDRPWAIVTAFFNFLIVGVGEEIIFRGVLFRWIDEKWGFAIALAVSSLLFGLIHLFNAGATLWSAFAIAVEAGLLLGAAYKYAGTLWLPIGIHWAWNFTQGNIFGFPVSGTEAGESLIRSSVQGPDLLTGGVFGAEASILSVALGLLLSLWFIVKVCQKTGAEA